MQTFHDSFILLAVSQLVTTSLYFLLHHRTQSGFLFILLFICLASYVAWPHSAFDESLDSYLYLVSLSTPILIYAISRYLFVDESRMETLAWVLLVYFVIFRVFIGGIFFSAGTAPNMVLIAAYMMPLAILIYFSVMAAIYTIQGFRADLLENRRTLRVYFVISTLLFIVPRLVQGLLVYSAMLLDSSVFSSVAFPEWLYAVYIFLIFLGFNLLIFRRHEDLLQLFTETRVAAGGQGETGPEPTPQDRVDDGGASGLVAGIVGLMTRDRLYARQRFTISDLAEALAVNEHRLRRTINHEMKFRNFNQFLNHYRLREASRRLVETEAPVSTIAYEVGYSSLSSFNSVFKAHFGVTPTLTATRLPLPDLFTTVPSRWPRLFRLPDLCRHTARKLQQPAIPAPIPCCAFNSPPDWVE